MPTSSNHATGVDEPVYLTVDEAAALLRVDRKVLYREIAAGRVRGVKRVGRVVRLRRSALLQDDAPTP